jgi:hypothetical protein
MARPATIRESDASIGPSASPSIRAAPSASSAARAPSPASRATVAAARVGPRSGQRQPDPRRAGVRERRGSLGGRAIADREADARQELEEVGLPRLRHERHVRSAGGALEQFEAAVRLAEEEVGVRQREGRVRDVMARLAVVGDVDGLLGGGERALQVPGRDRDVRQAVPPLRPGGRSRPAGGRARR